MAKQQLPKGVYEGREMYLRKIYSIRKQLIEKPVVDFKKKNLKSLIGVYGHYNSLLIKQQSKSQGKKLRPIDCLNRMNTISQSVVAGNSRRNMI